MIYILRYNINGRYFRRLYKDEDKALARAATLRSEGVVVVIKVRKRVSHD